MSEAVKLLDEAIASWENVANLHTLRENQQLKDLHNSEFFDAIISNDGHVYSTGFEVQPQ